MRVTGWTDYDNPEYEEWDGFPSHRTVQEYEEAKRVIADELRSKGYKFSGYYHQDGDYGAPLLDGKRFGVTQRSWGGIMAMAYPDQIDNTDGFGYLKWAWQPPESQVVPKKEDYE